MTQSFRQRHLLPLVMLLTVTLTACAQSYGASGFLQAPHTPPRLINVQTPGRMSAVELLQTLVLAVNSEDKTNLAYDTIPPAQRPKVSRTAFAQYVSCLRQATRGQVKAIRAIESDALSRKYATDAALQSDDLAHLAPTCAFYTFVYTDNAQRTASFLVGLPHNNGLPVLDGVWVDACNRLDTFAKLYFNAIFTHNTDALASLLSQSEVEPMTTTLNAAMAKKSADTIAFYHDRVTTAPLDSKLLTLLPGAATYEQYVTFSGNKSRRENRMVTFSDHNGVLAVSDRIESPLNPEDVSVIKSDRVCFTVGQTHGAVTSDDLQARLGSALDQGDSIWQTVRGDHRFTVRYPGVTISGIGVRDSLTTWHGTIDSATLAYSDLALGSGLKVGMPVSELYLRYPFARENNYVISGVIDKKDARIAVQVEKGIITKLTVTVVNKNEPPDQSGG